MYVMRKGPASSYYEDVNQVGQTGAKQTISNTWWRYVSYYEKKMIWSIARGMMVVAEGSRRPYLRK